ncbi:amino acid racemase [Kordia sp. TARA_039_SRF]|jgi:aspartate racemase|nr:amino acid racemase [Kordia sp. TARA_039_SRF]
MPSKTLGIISGMGTRAGLLFVNKLIDRIEAPKDQDFPEFILHNNSKVPDRTLSIVYGEESPEKQLLRSVAMLNESNVDFIVSTCVTSYYFIDQFQENLKSNILNPIDLVFSRILNEYPAYEKIGLLATTGTVNSKIFHKRFKNSSLQLITLNSHDQEEKFMKSVYMKGGFKSAHIIPEAYDAFEASMEALNNQGAELIIGGCTEAQIGYEKLKAPNTLYIDVIDVLIDEVIERLGLVKLNREENTIYNY